MTDKEQIEGLKVELEAHRMLLKSAKLANKVLAEELNALLMLLFLSQIEAK